MVLAESRAMALERRVCELECIFEVLLEQVEDSGREGVLARLPVFWPVWRFASLCEVIPPLASLGLSRSPQKTQPEKKCHD